MLTKQAELYLLDLSTNKVAFDQDTLIKVGIIGWLNDLLKMTPQERTEELKSIVSKLLLIIL